MNRKFKFSLITLAVFMILGAGVLAAQTPIVGEWGAYADNNEGGASTATLTEASETIGGRVLTTYTLRGTRAASAAVQWPYLGVSLIPNAAARQALQGAGGISFRVVGDGRPYIVEVHLSTVTDWAHYAFRFDTVNGQERHITIRWDQFQQPSDWGARVPFTRQHITQINFASTITGPVNIKIYDVMAIR